MLASKIPPGGVADVSVYRDLPPDFDDFDVQPDVPLNAPGGNVVSTTVPFMSLITSRMPSASGLSAGAPWGSVNSPRNMSRSSPGGVSSRLSINRDGPAVLQRGATAYSLNSFTDTV